MAQKGMTHATLLGGFLYMLLETLKQHLSDFEKPIKIIKPRDEGKLRYGGSTDESGYMFKQSEMVDLIDLYYNSKYEKGSKDKQGYKKLFLNKVKFPQNVAEKQTDVDVSNYNFIPDDVKDSNLVWFLKRKFIVWTRENNYGQLLNDLNKDFSKYGTCVLRRQGKILERIPLRQLINSQDATSLKLAPEEGGYVIVQHDLSYYQMTKMPNWDTENVEKFKGTKKVYEMYTLVDGDYFDGSEDEQVLAVCYICPDLKRDGADDDPVLFSEQIDEVPFEEAHWDKQDGRWLGIGVVEDLIENQIATNMIENIRRKHLIWGSKKIWQSQEANIKNLSTEVQDGQVLEVGARGEIKPVPLESRSLGEMQQGRESWDTNTEQRSFTFEVSTGESLPSGTPFRLGVVLSNSAARHFDLKREKFGLFLYQSFFSQLLPIFKKQTKAHNIAVANGEEGTEFIKDGMVRFYTNDRYNENLLNGRVRTWSELEAEVKEEMARKPFMFIKMPDKAYDDAKFYMQLDITRQEENTDATMATYTTLFQTIMQRNPADPRADKILDMIIALAGKNPNKVLGNAQNVQQAVTAGTQQPTAQFAGQQGLPALGQEANALPNV